MNAFFNRVYVNTERLGQFARDVPTAMSRHSLKNADRNAHIS